MEKKIEKHKNIVEKIENFRTFQLYRTRKTQEKFDIKDIFKYAKIEQDKLTNYDFGTIFEEAKKEMTTMWTKKEIIDVINIMLHPSFIIFLKKDEEGGDTRK